MKEEKQLISSHIFIFPFRWDYISRGKHVNIPMDKRLNVSKFVDLLMEMDYWEQDELNMIDSDDEYNKYVYFYDNVRDAIYGKKKYVKNRLVQCFKYKNVNENSTYNIQLSKNQEPYSLKVQAIKLKIYDTGVAAISFFLDNYNEEYTSEDILNINDYGRRIYPQYLPLEEVQKSFLAKKVSIKLSNEKTLKESFEYEATKDPNRISNVIMGLLGDKFKYDDKSVKKGEILISPTMDDRMFTLCIYINNTVSRILTKNSEEAYKDNEFWYKYVFVDNGYATCQDKEMLKKLIEKSTYTRWKNYGTIYGISRYSFMIIANEEDFSLEVLLKHFNNMYYEIALLALMERASILRISDEASKIAALDEDEALQSIKKLQKYYVEFINDLYFREVTAQEQGIEMYDKLTEMMKIERDVKRLGEEIDGIEKYTSMISNERISLLLRIITYVGIGFTACKFMMDLLGNKALIFKNWSFIKSENHRLWFGQATIIPISILILFLIMNKFIIKKAWMKIVRNLFYVVMIVLLFIVIGYSI